MKLPKYWPSAYRFPLLCGLLLIWCSYKLLRLDHETRELKAQISNARVELAARDARLLAFIQHRQELNQSEQRILLERIARLQDESDGGTY